MQTSIWWSPDVTGMSSSQTTNTKIKLSLFPPFSYLDTLETISAEFIQSVQPLYTCTGYAVQDTHWAKKCLTPSCLDCVCNFRLDIFVGSKSH